LFEHNGVYSQGTEAIDQLTTELNCDFTCPPDSIISDDYYTDITPDQIMEGVTEIHGIDTGRFEFFGEGKSILRSWDGYTIICSSPWP